MRDKRELHIPLVYRHPECGRPEGGNPDTADAEEKMRAFGMNIPMYARVVVDGGNTLQEEFLGP